MKEFSGQRQFNTTHWSLVCAADLDNASQTHAREALAELSRTYWFPLYTFVRNRGYSASDAQDLTQGFFAQIIETGGFASVHRNQGRFRSYLLGAMKHYLANEWHKSQAVKRGGKILFVDWDSSGMENRYTTSHNESDDPDFVFDYEWAMEIISDALDTLQKEMESAGKNELFHALKCRLTGENTIPNEQIAANLKMTEGAVKVAVHRLRQRYRDLLRSAIADTVCDEGEIDEEMHYLIEVLRKK